MKNSMVRLGWMAALLAAVSACRCGPEGVVRRYRNENTIEGRAKYVLHPEETLPRMREHYGRRPLSADSFRIEDAVPMPEVAGGDWVSVTVVVRGKNAYGAEVEQSDDYFLRRVDEDYKIDWEASVGHSELTLEAFKAQRPMTPTRFRILAKLSNYYNYEFRQAQGSHYSIELDGPRVPADLNGFVARNSPAGVALYGLLKDGRTHPVTLKLRYTPFSEDATITLITDVESLSWVVPP